MAQMELSGTVEMSALLMTLSGGKELERQVLSCNLAIRLGLTCGNWQVPFALLKHGKETQTFVLQTGSEPFFVVGVPLPDLRLRRLVQEHLMITASRVNTALHTCVQSCMSLNVTSESLFILRTRPAIRMDTSEVVEAMARLSCDGPGAEARCGNIKKNPLNAQTDCCWSYGNCCVDSYRHSDKTRAS